MSLNRNLSQQTLDESWPDNKYFFAPILIRTKYFLCDKICSLHISTKVFLLNILSCVRWSWLKSLCFLFGCKRIWPKSCKTDQTWLKKSVKLSFLVWFFFGFLLRAAQNMSSFTSLVYAVLLVVLLALSAEAFGFFEYGFPSFNPSPFFYPYYRGYADDFFDDD